MAKHKHLVSFETLSIAAIAVVFLGSVGLANYLQTSVLTQAEADIQLQADQIKQQNEQLKWKIDYEKQLKREIDDIARDAKVDVSQALNLHAAFKTCVTQQEASVGGDDQTFWSKNSECDDASRAVEDHLQDNLRPLRECSNFKNNAVGRRRELKDMARQLKDIKRSDKTLDVSAYEASLANLGSLVSKLEQCTVATLDATKDAQSEVDDGFRDWYDTVNEVRQQAEDVRRTTDAKKDFEQNIKKQCSKDKARELKNFEKELKRAGEVAGAKEAYEKVKALYDQLCVTLVGQMEQALQSNDIDTFESLRQDYWDQDRDYWDIFNEARQIGNIVQQMKDVKRVFKEKQRSCKDKDREYKRAVKEQRNTPELDASYQQVGCNGDLFKKMQETIATNDPQIFWDINSEYDEADRTFWDINNVLSSLGDIKRRLKDMTRECNDRANEEKRMKKEAGREGADVDISALEQIVVACNALVNETKKAAEAKDFDTLQTIEDRMWEEVRGPWEELSRGFWALRELKFLKNQIENIERDIEGGEAEVNKLLSRKQITQERADICLSFVTEGRDLLSGVKEAIDANDIESAQELMGQFEDLGFRAETQCSIFAHEREVDARAIMEQNFGDIEDQIAQQVLQRVLEKFNSEIIDKVVGNLATKVSTGLLEDFVKTKLNENVIAGILENLSYLESGQAGIEQILSFAKEGQDINRSAFEAGLTPCKDVPMDQWFMKYAAELFNMGIMQGKTDKDGNLTGECSPGENVRVAEVLKMVSVLANIDPSELQGEPSVACADWAKGYCAWGESRFQWLGKDYNRFATRAEVVRVILETFGVDLVTPEKPSFSDIASSHPHYRYVETAKALRLATGDKGKGTFRTFRPNDSVLRGESWRIIANAIRLARSFGEEVGEF